MGPCAACARSPTTPSACGTRSPTCASSVPASAWPAASFAAAPVRVHGTHQRALDALPATGKELDFQVVFVCELEDGLLRRVRAFFDVYDVGVQLGVLPVRGSLSAKALLALRGYGIGRSAG